MTRFGPFFVLLGGAMLLLGAYGLWRLSGVSMLILNNASAYPMSVTVYTESQFIGSSTIAANGREVYFFTARQEGDIGIACHNPRSVKSHDLHDGYVDYGMASVYRITLASCEHIASYSSS